MHKVWVDREQNLHQIEEMSDDHIRNCLKMKRDQESRWRRSWAHENEQDGLSYIPVEYYDCVDWIETFENELKRRRTKEDDLCS